MLDVLFELAREAAAAGDLDAARVAHEAAGKLLGTPPAVAASSPSSSSSAVIDLGRERRARGRS